MGLPLGPLRAPLPSILPCLRRGVPGGIPHKSRAQRLASRPVQRVESEGAGSAPGVSPAGREPRRGMTVAAVTGPSTSTASYLPGVSQVSWMGAPRRGDNSEAEQHQQCKQQVVGESVGGSKAEMKNRTCAGPSASSDRSPGGVSSGEEERSGQRRSWSASGRLGTQEVGGDGGGRSIGWWDFFQAGR